MLLRLVAQNAKKRGRQRYVTDGGLVRLGGCQRDRLDRGWRRRSFDPGRELEDFGARHERRRSAARMIDLRERGLVELDDFDVRKRGRALQRKDGSRR